MPCRTSELQREYQRKWMIARRMEWVLNNGPCAKCESWDRLEVDHREPATKALNTHSLWSMSRENCARIDELAKCQVLCHKCHAAKSTAARQPPVIHGTYSTYDTHRCRCDLCRGANAARNRRQRSSASFLSATLVEDSISL